MLEEQFISYGYTKEEYQKIRNDYSIKKYTESTLEKKFKAINNKMSELSYTKEEIIKIVKRLPQLYDLSPELIENKINFFKSFGDYSIEDIKKMTKELPQLLSFSIEKMTNKINELLNIGFSKELIIKTIKNMPSILGYKPEVIDQKIKFMEKLGYEKKEIFEMLKTLPTILCLTNENIEKKINDIISLGYTKEETLYLTKNLPTLFSYGIENITKKVTFFDSINLHELPLIAPKALMQSIELTYARYMFYYENDKEVSISQYNKLFINNKHFEKLYKITKEELIAKYNYEKDMEELVNGRTK